MMIGGGDGAGELLMMIGAGAGAITMLLLFAGASHWNRDRNRGDNRVVDHLTIVHHNNSDRRPAGRDVMALNRHIDHARLLHRGGDRAGDEFAREAGGKAAPFIGASCRAASTRLAIVVATRSFFIRIPFHKFVADLISQRLTLGPRTVGP